ncbi:MAG: VCBS repeat-containing protein [Gaiellaceae bacterium]
MAAPTFENLNPAGLAGNPMIYSASWADYDADGKLDLLSIGCADMFCLAPVSRLYHSNGDGSFSENTRAGLPGLLGGWASWGDYDLDGRADVLISGYENDDSVATRLYHNNGDGTFSENTKTKLAGAPWTNNGAPTAWADYDNDGRPDILLLGTTDAAVVPGDLAPSVPRLYHNNGDGTFSEDTGANLPSLFRGLLTWSDFDGDGNADLLLQGATSAAGTTYVSHLYRGDGHGGFSEDSASGLPAVEPDWTSWGDYDGDGRPDVILSTYDYTDPAALNASTKLFHNNGDGTFSENTASGLPNVADSQFFWGDFDSDGRLDVLFNGCVDTCPLDTTALYRNDGEGSFSQDKSAGLPDVFAWVYGGDYNSDGRLDALVWGSPPAWGDPALFTVYRNDSASAVVPAAPAKLEARLTARRQMTLSWNTVVNGLTYNLRVGTSPGGSDVVSPLSTSGGSREIVDYGNAGGRTFAKLNLPTSGAATYYWSVQAVAANYTGSAFAAEQTFPAEPQLSLELSASKISPCGRSSVVAGGTISPAFRPGATVVLKRRFKPHAGFRKFATATTTSAGTFRVRNVGKAARRSFWVVAMSDSKLAGSRLVSASRHVTVEGISSCPGKKKPRR